MKPESYNHKLPNIDFNKLQRAEAEALADEISDLIKEVVAAIQVLGRESRQDLEWLFVEDAYNLDSMVGRMPMDIDVHLENLDDANTILIRMKEYESNPDWKKYREFETRLIELLKAGINSSYDNIFKDFMNIAIWGIWGGVSKAIERKQEELGIRISNIEMLEERDRFYTLIYQEWAVEPLSEMIRDIDSFLKGNRMVGDNRPLYTQFYLDTELKFSIKDGSLQVDIVYLGQEYGGTTGISEFANAISAAPEEVEARTIQYGELVAALQESGVKFQLTDETDYGFAGES